MLHYEEEKKRQERIRDIHTHSGAPAAATYFGKESFEELPVLEVGVVKQQEGKG